MILLPITFLFGVHFYLFIYLFSVCGAIYWPLHPPNDYGQGLKELEGIQTEANRYTLNILYWGLKRDWSAIDKSLPLPSIWDAQELWAQEYTLIQPNPFHQPEKDQASLRPGFCTSGTTVLMVLASWPKKNRRGLAQLPLHKQRQRWLISRKSDLQGMDNGRGWCLQQ